MKDGKTIPQSSRPFRVGGKLRIKDVVADLGLPWIENREEIGGYGNARGLAVRDALASGIARLSVRSESRAEFLAHTALPASPARILPFNRLPSSVYLFPLSAYQLFDLSTETGTGD